MLKVLQELCFGLSVGIGSTLALTLSAWALVQDKREILVASAISLAIWLTLSAMFSRTIWHHSSLGHGWAVLSLSFWRQMLSDARIFVLIFVILTYGMLSQQAYDGRQMILPWWLSGPALTAILVLLIRNILLDAKASETFMGPSVSRPSLFGLLRLLWRRREGWQFNLLLGLFLGFPRFVVSWYRLSETGEAIPRLIALGVVYLSSLLIFLLVRSAGVQAQTLVALLSAFQEELEPSPFLMLLSLMYLFVGMAETSRGTRINLCLTWSSGLAYSTARGIGWHSQMGFPVTRVMFMFFVVHVLKVYWHASRDMREWSGPIAFLKASEIRRRRAADPNFLLNRRQDMNPEVFGDPMHAKYIYVVSHAWLSPAHADPDGIHLDLVLECLDANFASHSRFAVVRWWRRYYYMDAEGDVLIFFDMSSLYQAPRSPPEDEEFKKSLALMNFLYYSFTVLVIDEIPETVRHHGCPLSYMDKGWCWAEASIARLGCRLDNFSCSIIAQLNEDEGVRERYAMSLRDALFGFPGYPPELLQRGNEVQLMDFRNTQTVKGKIFTNGKSAADQVLHILAVFEQKQKLRKLLEAGETVGVSKIFDDEEFFTPSKSGITREDLANTVFDGSFCTPLHLAVASDLVELVEVILAAGAKPRRNMFGCYPWEYWSMIPRVSAAACVARRSPSSAGLSGRAAHSASSVGGSSWDRPLTGSS